LPQYTTPTTYQGRAAMSPRDEEVLQKLREAIDIAGGVGHLEQLLTSGGQHQAQQQQLQQEQLQAHLELQVQLQTQEESMQQRLQAQEVQLHGELIAERQQVAMELLARQEADEKLARMEAQVQSAEGKTAEAAALLEDAVRAAVDAHAQTHRREQETSTLQQQVVKAQEQLQSMQYTNKALEDEVLRLRTKSGYTGSSAASLRSSQAISASRGGLTPSPPHSSSVYQPATATPQPYQPAVAIAQSSVLPYAAASALPYGGSSSSAGDSALREHSGVRPHQQDSSRSAYSTPVQTYPSRFSLDQGVVTRSEQIAQAFSRADLNNDGVVSREESSQAALGAPYTNTNNSSSWNNGLGAALRGSPPRRQQYGGAVAM